MYAINLNQLSVIETEEKVDIDRHIGKAYVKMGSLTSLQEPNYVRFSWPQI